MKKITILSFCFLFLAGCAGSEPARVQQNANVPPPAQPRKTDELSTVSSHSQTSPGAKSDQLSDANPAAPTAPNSGGKTKWTQSGNPIDTSEFDAEIKQAEAKLKSAPKDESLKNSLAEAYVKRGVALTDARQYASALGDYRRALKLDPSNEEAKKWIGQIVGIYDSINRSYPAEGEEPPPLPFKKGA